MNNQESWADTVTPKLKDDIEHIAVAAYANACELLHDAKILLREDRCARGSVGDSFRRGVFKSIYSPRLRPTEPLGFRNNGCIEKASEETRYC